MPQSSLSIPTSASYLAGPQLIFCWRNIWVSFPGWTLGLQKWFRNGLCLALKGLTLYEVALLPKPRHAGLQKRTQCHYRDMPSLCNRWRWQTLPLRANEPLGVRDHVKLISEFPTAPSTGHCPSRHLVRAGEFDIWMESSSPLQVRTPRAECNNVDQR